jgi:catalase
VNPESQSFASGSVSSNPISTPIRRIRSGCCARAATGHAAAPRGCRRAEPSLDTVVAECAYGNKRDCAIKSPPTALGTDAEAEALVAKDRESNGRDLLNAIEAGDFPRWTLFIQVMTEAQAKTQKHNPFDVTKVWPKAEYPLIEVGVMELNRYPENYFAEVEQAAFSPANIVPGIGFSPDKMLQARLFSYGDTQRYRLGVNFNHIPVNTPKCPFQSYHRDGKMRTDGNLGGTVPFNPNSAGLWDNQPDFAEPPMVLGGDAAHFDHRVDDDHWEQPGKLFRMMTSAQRHLLFENTARAMGDAKLHIKQRHVANCTRADSAYGAGVAKALGLDHGALAAAE